MLEGDTDLPTLISSSIRCHQSLRRISHSNGDSPNSLPSRCRPMDVAILKASPIIVHVARDGSGGVQVLFGKYSSLL